MGKNMRLKHALNILDMKFFLITNTIITRNKPLILTRKFQNHSFWVEKIPNRFKQLGLKIIKDQSNWVQPQLSIKYAMKTRIFSGRWRNEKNRN